MPRIARFPRLSVWALVATIVLLTIGAPLEAAGANPLLGVNPEATDNRTVHHTNGFSVPELLVLRRGATFDVDVKVAKGWDGLGQVEFVAEAQGETSTELPLQSSGAPLDRWGTTLVTRTASADGSTESLTMRLTIPSSAPAGDYRFSAVLRAPTTRKIVSQLHFPKPLFLLFNPWAPADDVYLASDVDRNEYVLRDVTSIFVGTTGDFTEMTWNVELFSAEALNTLRTLLRGVPPKDRGLAPLTARALAPLVNEQLLAKWEALTAMCTPGGTGTGGGGNLPACGSRSSKEIFAAFLARTGPRPWGTTYTYAPVLLTLFRTLGIPARAVTGFQFATDTNDNGAIDKYYTKDDKGFFKVADAPASENVWNFNNWVEAWMKRQDLHNAGDGWQFVSADTGRQSDGRYRIGPAPVTSVKALSRCSGAVGPGYDVKFVATVACPNFNLWVKNKATGKFDLTRTTAGDPFKPSDGTRIITRRPGAPVTSTATAKHNPEDLVLDLTSQYAPLR